jgi:Protein of unknown function (DUF2786)
MHSSIITEKTIMTDIMDKLRKLQRLGNDSSTTEHERNVALEMMQRLMLQHNIKDVQEHKEVHAVMGEWMNVDRGDLWEQFVAVAVAKLYNCRVVQRQSIGSYQFVGKPDNIDACGETFLWVCGQVEALYKETLRGYARSLDKRGRADLRRSFKQACATRIHERVNELVAKIRNEIPAHMALVVIDQSLAAADELLKGMRSAKTRYIRPGIGSYAGRQAGDRVQLQGSVGQPKRKMIQ